MKILAIDTSTEACSAALLIDGAVRERYQVAPREHANLILSMAQELLGEAGVSLGQLDALAFGRGPGAFTGVRIGVGVAQGIAFAVDLPVAPISSLASLAHGAWRTAGHTRIIPAIDARMGEIYWGLFVLDSERLMRPLGGEHVTPAGDVDVPPGDAWHGVGSGWGTHGDILCRQLSTRVTTVTPDAICEARDIVTHQINGRQIVGQPGIGSEEGVDAAPDAQKCHAEQPQQSQRGRQVLTGDEQHERYRNKRRNGEQFHQRRRQKRQESTG